MRYGAKVVASWRIQLLVLALALLSAVVVAKDSPNTKVTSFDNPPLGLNYFEDSDVIIFHDIEERNIYRSDDAGVSWNTVKGVPEHAASLLVMHRFEPKTAFVLTDSRKHYKSEDQGATWKEWDSGTSPTMFETEILAFHAEDPKRIIFNGMVCDGWCTEQATYTTDGFDSVHMLRESTGGCHWAKASPEFTTGDKELDKKRVLCITVEPISFFGEDKKISISDSFFEKKDGKIDQFEPKLDAKKDIDGVVNIAIVKSYILVATSSPFSDEMALYVSSDTQNWNRALFPTDDSHDHTHQIHQNAYTVLESTNYSIQIDVLTSHPAYPMGVLFTSNSNGTYFIENEAYTNRNQKGHVDFEMISGIQGVYMINVVDNGADVEKKKGEDKKVVTKITFDDGRTFDHIKAGDERIHLHSETELNNIGRVFSSPAPGLVMGNGNTGKNLDSFEKANLYVSDDAGQTWKQALKGPHKFEFGDSGSILVAVKDSKDVDVDEFSYSLDHGENWKQEKLPDDLKIKPAFLTTTQDSTSLKFLLVGQTKDKYIVVALDFDGLHERKCGDSDMEDWHARLDKDGKPTCIMGHKQTYQRRKKTADCFIMSEFKDPVPKIENCKCTDADFECDYNFQRNRDDRSECLKVGPIARPDGVCKKPEDKFKGSSGWRMIPGNTCERTDGKQKDDEVERDCSDAVSPPSTPANGEVSSKIYEFDTKIGGMEKFYLERGASSQDGDETIIARPSLDMGDGTSQIENKIWRTTDHGKEWKKILEGEDIRGIYPHLYFKDVVFFTTKGKKVFYSVDRGRSFHSFEAPTDPGHGLPLSFHPDKKDWLIWLGQSCEDIGGKESCFPEASISRDRGDHWTTLLRFAEKCEFTGSAAYKLRSQNQIVCLVREEERNDVALTVKTSDDFFQDADEISTFGGQVTNFATMSEFIMLAGDSKDKDKDKNQKEQMKAYASVDGKHFEQAQFPFNFHEGHASEYTVLDSSTHAVNLFVLTEGTEDRQFGSVIKSNSNGTTYVVSASHVNANAETYVDFEKVPGIEGVTVINTVANYDSKKDKTKNVQTQISHNDGSQWSYLPPPKKDVDGKSYKCSSSTGDKTCALHLHHYTERQDRRKTFAAATAVGLIFGIGNVGSKLEALEDADTFLSTDAGMTWMNVKKGHWTWQYGDQGSIIVLVQRATGKDPVKTKIVSYSVDEGKTWKDLEFTKDEVTVQDITTVRAGTSRNFLVWYKDGSGKQFAANLDFTGLTDKACKATDDGDSDYYLWAPKHPMQDNDCLFGHVAQYLRKKTDRNCYNEKTLTRLHGYTDCECSRRDYECAYNYQLDGHDQCSLVQGLEPLSGEEWCANHPNETSWYEPTGYRKIPLSTCKGGNELDKTSRARPCGGHEDEFERTHRVSGVAIFFAVVIPFALAGAIGWYVYRNWSGNFGQIRLGENGTSTFDSDQPWVKYPVIALSAVVAVVAALPLVFTSLWRTAVGAYERVGGGSNRSWTSSYGARRFTTRDSFARGRGDYSTIEDEGELLGEESDEEV